MTMSAMDALLRRNSAPRLTDPAPCGDVLQTLLQAGLRAPDHARLKPWRFLVVEGQGRVALGDVFAQAALADNPDLDAAALDKLRNNPLRAPLIVVVIARLQEHPKVPEIEQLLSAGCAAHAILLAATPSVLPVSGAPDPWHFTPGCIVRSASGLTKKLWGSCILAPARAMPSLCHTTRSVTLCSTGVEPAAIWRRCFSPMTFRTRS